MGIIKKLDRQAGTALRWFANLVTGNSYRRIERMVNARMDRLEITLAESLEANRRLHDDMERNTLAIYKRANRK